MPKRPDRDGVEMRDFCKTLPKIFSTIIVVGSLFLIGSMIFWTDKELASQRKEKKLTKERLKTECAYQFEQKRLSMECYLYIQKQLPCSDTFLKGMIK